jgi:DNA-binding MarR family transcriptional regulator/GNAT superfamily N-acetyltransferase
MVARQDKPPAAEQISAVRRFNRFYTRQIGLLEERLLRSEFSLTEARILFELAHRDKLTATQLGGDLALDAGYLSRILKKFEKRGLLARQSSSGDARRMLLTLTEQGRRAFEPLNEASREQVTELLAALSAGEREKLTSAMSAIERLLGTTPEPGVPYLLRPLRVGDAGWITHRQGLLYHQEYGWDESYEALVARILSEFVQKFDPRYETSWIAEREGEVVGSVFVVRESEETAKLRLLYVEPAARGLGIGRRLVDECIAFARSKGYTSLTLWTNDILVAARRIYQAAGFRLVKEEPHRSFGKDLVGQTWALDL